MILFIYIVPYRVVFYSNGSFFFLIITFIVFCETGLLQYFSMIIAKLDNGAYEPIL